MDKKTIFANAFNLLSQAKEEMINGIIKIVDEEGLVSYNELVDEHNGYSEDRYIRYNENGDLCVFNENGEELYHLNDLSIDELYSICNNYKV